MSAQLSLLVGPGELELVEGRPSRRLPVLRLAPAPAPVVNAHGRRLSKACVPGFRKGEKPGNYGNTYPPEPVKAKDVERLMGACRGGYAGARDRCLWAFLWGTGARIAEALALLPTEIDMDERTVTILRGKGGKRRTVGLPQQTAEELQRWLDKRAELGVTDAQPVFCVVSRPTIGKPLYQSCVRKQLHDCAKRAGIRRRVTPHQFRHGRATDLARRGVPINVISKVLGHSNSAITARYIDHVDQETAWDALRNLDLAVAA